MHVFDKKNWISIFSNSGIALFPTFTQLKYMMKLSLISPTAALGWPHCSHQSHFSRRFHWIFTAKCSIEKFRVKGLSICSLELHTISLHLFLPWSMEKWKRDDFRAWVHSHPHNSKLFKPAVSLVFLFFWGFFCAECGFCKSCIARNENMFWSFVWGDLDLNDLPALAKAIASRTQKTFSEIMTKWKPEPDLVSAFC